LSCPTAYENLQERKVIREAAWMRPGWDEVVAHTGNTSASQQ